MAHYYGVGGSRVVSISRVIGADSYSGDDVRGREAQQRLGIRGGVEILNEATHSPG